MQARVGHTVAARTGVIVAVADTAIVIPSRPIGAARAVEAIGAVGAPAGTRWVGSVGDAVAVGTGGAVATADTTFVEHCTQGDILLRYAVAPDAGGVITPADSAGVEYLVRSRLVIAARGAVVVSPADTALVILLA